MWRSPSAIQARAFRRASGRACSTASIVRPPLMYEQTFLSLRYGFGAAIATVLLALMTGIIVILLWRLFLREAD